MWSLIEQTVFGAGIAYVLWCCSYRAITGHWYEGTPEEDPIVKKAMDEGKITK